MDLRDSHRRGKFGTRTKALVAALLIIALGASACAGGTAELVLPADEGSGTVAVEASLVQNESAETADSPTATSQNTGATDSDDGTPFGPRPDLQTWSVNANAIQYSGGEPVGISYIYTDVDSDDQDITYLAIGDSNGVRAAYLRQEAVTRICVENADGCGGGDASAAGSFASQAPFYSFSAWAPFALDAGLRLPPPILLGEYAGWEIVDDNFSFDGRPGRCYRSLGSYQWEGDPEPTTTSFPEGDVACVLFYEHVGEYLVSYDFGGDGTLEVETVRLATTVSEADLVMPDYAPAEFKQAALMTIIDNAVNADFGTDYIVIAG